jgi:pilus assembly protein TadC
MPDFRYDTVINSKEKTVKFINPAKPHIRRIFSEIPFIILSICCVIACFIGNTIYLKENKGKSNREGAASVINALIIIVLGIIFEKASTKLTNWENH